MPRRVGRGLVRVRATERVAGYLLGGEVDTVKAEASLPHSGVRPARRGRRTLQLRLNPR